jgi:hypothetical protein
LPPFDGGVIKPDGGIKLDAGVKPDSGLGPKDGGVSPLYGLPPQPN